jgi:hypothetical protein
LAAVFARFRVLFLAAVCAGASAAASAQSPQVVEHVTDPQYTIRFTFEPPTEWPEGGELHILFDQTDTGDGHALVLSKHRCCFARTSQPRSPSTASCSAAPRG